MSGLQPHLAKDEILALFKEHWDATAPAVATVTAVLYDNDDSPAEPPVPPFARVNVLFEGGLQRSMGQPGNRKFERAGVVVVQVFAKRGEGVTTASQLAKIALDAFEGEHTPGGVWFRNGRLQTVGHRLNAYQVNAVVDFTFDETK